MAEINNWTFQWKMGFNRDPSKQAEEVIFSQKSKIISHPPLFFNNTQVSQSSSQNHLDIIFDEQLIHRTFTKITTPLPRSVFITIYKAFVRTRLDYGEIIYDEAYNASFHHKLELFKYNACLPITEVSEVPLRKGCTRSYAWSPFSFGIGSEKYVFSTRFIKIISLVIFPIYYYCYYYYYYYYYHYYHYYYY